MTKEELIQKKIKNCHYYYLCRNCQQKPPRARNSWKKVGLENICG